MQDDLIEMLFRYPTKNNALTALAISCDLNIEHKSTLMRIINFIMNSNDPITSAQLVQHCAGSQHGLILANAIASALNGG